MPNFGNNASDGYNAQPYKYEPKWEVTGVDLNPDHQRSRSAMYVEPVGPRVSRWLLQVKGLGVITILTATSMRDPEAPPQVGAMSLVTKADVGPCPAL